MENISTVHDTDKLTLTTLLTKKLKQIVRRGVFYTELIRISLAFPVPEMRFCPPASAWTTELMSKLCCCVQCLAAIIGGAVAGSAEERMRSRYGDNCLTSKKERAQIVWLRRFSCCSRWRWRDWIEFRFFACVGWFFVCHQHEKMFSRRSEDAVCDRVSGWRTQWKRSVFRVSTRKSGFCHNSIKSLLSIVALVDPREQMFLLPQNLCRDWMTRLASSHETQTRAAALVPSNNFFCLAADSIPIQ